MNEKQKYPKMLIWLVVALIILAAFAAFVVHQANVSRSNISVWGKLPDFQFTAAHNGEPFGLEQMKGKLTVVDFIFTSCKSACPIMTPNFTELYQLYKGSDKVLLVSITVDPERDSLPVLSEYARVNGVTDDRWVFLWAPVEDVIRLCEQGFMLPADNLPMGHTTKFTLVDGDGAIRSYHEGLDRDGMVLLKNNIHQLAGAW
jgi:protein SCO1/2